MSSSANSKRGRPPLYMNGQSALVRAPCQPDDGIGPYTREQLMRMDCDFVAAVERAIAAGKESRQAATHGAKQTRPR